MAHPSIMIIKWRKVLVAGVAGLVTGKIYSWLRKHPNDPLLIPVARGVVCAGISGSVLGLGIAWYRNRPLYAYSISLGANFALATGSFLALHHLVTQMIKNSNSHLMEGVAMTYTVSGGSGLAVGTLLAALSRRTFSSVCMTGVSGLVVGVIGHFSYDQFEIWRKQKAIELNYPELVTKSDKLPWSYERFETAWLGFWHRQSKTGAVESDITLLEQSIREEKQNIEALEIELANIGYNDHSEEYDNNKINRTTNIVQQNVTDH